MSPATLLRELRRRGVQLWVEGGRLRCRAPRGALTPELREALSAHKDALVALLGSKWSEDAAERLLREALRRCAEVFDPAGPPWPPLPDPEPHDRAIEDAWERQDLAALRRALADYEAAVKRAVEEHRRREGVA